LSARLDYGLLDRAGADRLAFYPRPERRPAPAGATDYQVEVEPGVSLGARLYAAGPELPTILYFHGNGEVVPDHDGLAPYYTRAGANLFVFEFRGYGTSNGRPTFATLVFDAGKIVTFFHATLDELGFSGCRLVMGRSLGAHSALEVAANAADRIAGLIIESGAGDVRRFLARLGVDPSVDGKARQLAEGHEAKVRGITLPALIIHGAEDELVPVSRATELQSMLGTPSPEMLIIPGAGHNDLTWVAAREYFGAIGTFVARVCGA
jgi:pimeloyl-ACP methyl ester carboxylesterase